MVKPSYDQQQARINIDMSAVHREPHFVCEWCEPSDIPEREPERCTILYCPVHGMKCWHWPKRDE